jgi:hypothetical protein
MQLSKGAKRILVVNENAAARHETAIILSTHGYDVDTASGAADREPGALYDLVTLAWSKRLRDDIGAWQDFQQKCPSVRFAFISTPRLRLSSVFLNGRKIRDAQGGDSDVIAEVERALRELVPARTAD